MLSELLSPDFWKSQLAATLNASLLFGPSLLIACFLGWLFKKSADDGKLKDLRAQKNAAKTRLQLANYKYEALLLRVAVLTARVGEQDTVISDLKKSAIREQQLYRVIRDRLENLVNSNTEITMTVTDLSASAADLGTILTIAVPKSTTTVSPST
jgi:hypothetical protein